MKSECASFKLRAQIWVPFRIQHCNVRYFSLVLTFGKIVLIFLGAMKQGQGTSGTFKAFNLTYLHALHAGMVYLYRLTLLHARTNVPLSSARLQTSFQQPLSLQHKISRHFKYLIKDKVFIMTIKREKVFCENIREQSKEPSLIHDC